MLAVVTVLPVALQVYGSEELLAGYVGKISTVATSAQRQIPPWRREIDDVVRAGCGGMLFGIPLLYTMEVWWAGNRATPQRMAVVLGVTFVPVFLLNRTSGFRSTKDIRVRDALIDTVEAVAIGVLCATVLLFLIGQIGPSASVRDAAGQIVYEAAPFSLGVAVAHHFLRRGRAENDDDDHANDDEGGINATAVDIGATLIGALFIAFNIAPTDEIAMIASELSPLSLLAVVAASLLVSYAIVFEGGFSNEEKRRSQPGILQHPITETVASYLLACLAAVAMLWFFQRLGDESLPWRAALGHVVVFALPAAVGGAAGRLAV